MLVYVLAYVVGGIPWAVIVVKLLHGLDVRHEGTGNIGARNSVRVGGPVAGALVLLLDALKSALMVALADSLIGGRWAGPLAGAIAVFGHCYSLYMLPAALRQPWPGWRVMSVRVGGMGLASGLGVMLMLTPWTALPVLLLGAFILFVLKRPHHAGVVMALTTPALAAIWGYPGLAVLGMNFVCLIIISKHLADLVPVRAQPA